MYHKNIKRIIRKQLKRQYPNWTRRKRKVKKPIIRAVMAADRKIAAVKYNK